MTTDFNKPEVYYLSLRQVLIPTVIVISIFLLYLWIRWGEISGFDLLVVLLTPIALYAISPRVILAPDGLSVTILKVPWIRRVPWYKLRRAGMPYSGKWIWIERLDESSDWIWVSMLNMDGPNLLKRIASRYEHHLNQFCHTCEYNLQGNTTGSCPECGEKSPQLEPSLRIDIQPKPGT